MIARMNPLREPLPERLVVAIGGNATHPESIRGTTEEQEMVAARAARSLLPILSLGRFAHAALSSGEARVIAVFERSCYVETPSGLACIGVVGNGPLNAHCASFPQVLAVGDSLRFEVDEASVWRPRSAPAWKADIVTASLARLREAARDRLPCEGFGYLLDAARERPPVVQALARWLVDPAGTLVDAAGLIGLGPGLTPSGDDLIGGALCALHKSSRGDFAARLAAWAMPIAQAGTNRISYAHLACAAEGECGKTVNDAIVAIIAGDAPDLDRIDAIGHTSGWDALAGAALALEATLRFAP